MHGRAVAEGARPLGLHPFAGVRYRGSGGDVLDRTMVAPDAWDGSQPPGREDPHHVSHLLDGVFAPTGAPPAGAGADLDGWLADDVVGRDSPALYVYRRTDALGSTRGLLGAVDLSGTTSASLLPHEDVRGALVERQSDAVRALRGQVDPIVAVAAAPSTSSPSPLATLLRAWTRATPDWHAEADGVEHELWVVTDPDRLAEALAVPTGPVLVADGHHRLRAWSRTEPDGTPWGLVWVVDEVDEPLRLGAVHRVVPALDLRAVADDRDTVVTVLGGAEAATAVLEQGDGPRAVLVQGERWLLVRPDDQARAPDCTTPSEPTCWLHQRWLPAWGVPEQAVRFVHGTGSAVRSARRTDDAAVLLPAPSLAEVRTAAASGTMLPAKATSFVPKPRMGLVMRHWTLPGDDVRSARPVLPRRA